MRKRRSAAVRVLVLAVSVGLLSGCTADRSPVLPVSVAFVAVGGRPCAVELGLAPDTLLVSCMDAQAVYEVDLQTRAQIRCLTVRSGPGDLVPDPARQSAYCLHLRENALTLIGGNPPVVERTLGTGNISLASGALRPGHNEFWICDGVSAIHALIPKGMQVKDKINVGRYPQKIAFTRDGRFAFVTLKGENAVAVIELDQRREVARVAVGIYPQDILLVGNTACISNNGSHDVSLVDTVQYRERARLKVRRKPNALSAHGNTLWVSCEDSYRLVAINVAQAVLIGTVKTGFYPGKVKALADGSLAVADLRHNRIAIITPVASAEQ